MNEKEEFSTHFRAVQLRFSRFYAHFLTQTDLTLQQFALLNQLVNLGPMSMTDASEKLLITKPAVTNLVDRLEEGKYIKRIPHPKDRRVYVLKLQPKGRRVVKRIQMLALRFLLKTLNRFPSRERKVILRFYALLSHTMDKFLLRTRGG